MKPKKEISESEPLAGLLEQIKLQRERIFNELREAQKRANS